MTYRSRRNPLQSIRFIRYLIRCQNPLRHAEGDDPRVQTKSASIHPLHPLSNPLSESVQNPHRHAEGDDLQEQTKSALIHPLHPLSNPLSESAVRIRGQNLFRIRCVTLRAMTYEGRVESASIHPLHPLSNPLSESAVRIRCQNPLSESVQNPLRDAEDVDLRWQGGIRFNPSVSSVI